MKVKDILQDSMVIVGCIVGVSFVTGKEAQTFVGSGQNILLFAIVFALAMLIVRLFCNKNKLQNSGQFVRFAFKKWGDVVYFLLLTCYFVCMVTTLATVESSMRQVVGKVPLVWSAVVALTSAWVLRGGVDCFKTVSTMAFVGAFVTFLFVSAQSDTPTQMDIAPISTILYSLFSLTMVLPTCCKMSQKSTKQNIICVVVATSIVALLLWWVESVADFSQMLPVGGKLKGVGKICLALTIGLCGVSGVVANAMPLFEGLTDVIGDKKLLRFVLFALAWAFSCLGLDVILQYGYMFVAFVGLMIVVRCVSIKKSRQQCDETYTLTINSV